MRHPIARQVICLIAVLVAAIALLPATPAAAVTCTESSHCYLYFRWNDAPALGNVSGHVMATAISAAPGSRTNQEAWISLGDATFSLWIEQGIKYGLGPDGQYHTGVWFWEYRRPGDTSPVFHLSSFSFIGDIPWGFHYHGGNTWYLQRGDQNPINYTTVPSAPGPTQAIIAGTEFTYNENLSCGQQTLLAYQLSGSTTQHYAWNTPTNFDAFPYSSGSGTYSLVNDENFYFTNYC